MELFINNQYVVLIQETQNGCSVKIPRNIINVKKSKEKEISYNLSEEGLIVIEGGKTKKLHLPKYTIRAIVISDIFIKCFDSEINPRLHLVLDKNNNKCTTIKSIVDTNLSEEEQVKEKKLFEHIHEILFCDSDDLVEKHPELEEAFELITNLIKSGGI
ncbi:MAG: hypothetical protein ACXABK_07220 [Candidatus Heimdallarchaeaceae archaeon]|jgi:hypothetical protein